MTIEVVIVGKNSEPHCVIFHGVKNVFKDADDENGMLVVEDESENHIAEFDTWDYWREISSGGEKVVT